MQFRKLLLFFFAANAIYRNSIASNVNSTQSTLVKIDCFDKLAENQKLDSRDIYNSIDAHSADDCKLFCTNDGLRCLAFSYGFNKCQLSPNVIKEDEKLKTIGTIFDENYELYSKKRDCKIIQNSSSGSLSSDRKNHFFDTVKFVDLKLKDAAVNRQQFNGYTLSHLKFPLKIASGIIGVRPKIQDEPTKAYSCFEQIFNEKKAPKHFVRIITYCESFTECEKRCFEESDFYCFGFNFQKLVSSIGNKCELVDVPLSSVSVADAAQVWLSDQSYGYFERNANSTNVNCMKKPYPNHSFENCTNCGKKEHFYNYQVHVNNLQSPNTKYRNHHDHFNMNRNMFRNQISSFRSSSENIFQISKFKQEDCSVRIKNGFKLYKSIVKTLLVANSFYVCEQLCYEEKLFNCRTFSYRYSFGVHDPTENCHLSDKPFRLIDTYNEVEPNHEYDIYSMNNLNECSNSIKTYEKASDCFIAYKNGFRLHSDIVMGAKKTKSLSECEHECLTTRDFVCRAFSFSDNDQNNLNCQMTNNEWLDYLMPDDNYHLFKRDSFGHGCEQDKVSYFLSTTPEKKQFVDSVCYGTYSKSLSIRARSAKLTLRNVNSDERCCDECTKLRVNGPLNCLSFSYSPKEKLCRFSDLPVSQLIYEDCLENEAQNQSQLRLWDVMNTNCNTAQKLENYEMPANSLKENEYARVIEDGEESPHRTTVSGYACKSRSFCRLNKLANFWFCNIEHSFDHDSWDYCCIPDHHCGYSHDYDYEWCYVGQNKTQWRKCSTDQNSLFAKDNHPRPVSYLHKDNPVKNNIVLDSTDSYSEPITVSRNVTNNPSQNSNISIDKN